MECCPGPVISGGNFSLTDLILRACFRRQLPRCFKEGTPKDSESVRGKEPAVKTGLLCWELLCFSGLRVGLPKYRPHSVSSNFLRTRKTIVNK